MVDFPGPRDPSHLHVSRRHFFGLGTSSLALLLASCGQTQPGSSTSKGVSIAPTLRLAFQPPYIGVFVLQQQKLLEQAFKGTSIDIQYRLLLSLDPIAEALSGGSVDLGMGGTPIAAIASHQPIRVVAVVEHSPKTHAILVRSNSSIKTIQDLKGKKIGGPSGKNDSFPLLVLQRAGIKETEVEWLKLENNEGRSALLTGAIDAWRTWDPFYADIQTTKEAIPLVDGESYIQNYVALFGRTNYVTSYPDTVKRFIQAYKQALDYVKSHHTTAVNLFVEKNKLTSQVAELTLSRRQYVIEAPTQDYIDDLVQQSKLLKQFGVLQQEPDWTTVVDTTLAKQALGS
ncbi:MAG TPA: aliphatic sulfonate ABC transporter substrate-binding protein [Ktedonobacteraceae bacterium]|nr:aliphatic sulfonate ABC transporter substrate-binding protein [Ktedonobacteraceae bacterium]